MISENRQTEQLGAGGLCVACLQVRRRAFDVDRQAVFRMRQRLDKMMLQQARMQIHEESEGSGLRHGLCLFAPREWRSSLRRRWSGVRPVKRLDAGRRCRSGVAANRGI